MQMMLCDRTYPELRDMLAGKKVLVWTCNTCARLCDVGGADNASALAAKLREDGIDAVAATAVAASCIASNIRKCQTEISGDFDTIVALTCDIGSALVRTVSGKETVNPVATVGTGYRDDARRCIVSGHGTGKDIPLSEEAARRGLRTGPLVRPPSTI